MDTSQSGWDRDLFILMLTTTNTSILSLMSSKYYIKSRIKYFLYTRYGNTMARELPRQSLHKDFTIVGL